MEAKEMLSTKRESASADLLSRTGGGTSFGSPVIEEQERARDELAAWRSGTGNSFTSDAFFQRLLHRHLGGTYEALAARLHAVAESARALEPVVQASNHNDALPVVRRHDRFGTAVEEVVFHPTYHEAGRIFWKSGVLTVLAHPGNELTSGAIAYLLDQYGEAGHACPVACTAGAIKLLQQCGSDEQRSRYLPALLSDDYEHRLHAAQFVTEVQGGSDVGLNACVAHADPKRPGWWRISGEKWFCSVADAGLFVVSARPEGAPEGTRGLGLFLIPRLLDGRPNGFRLRRLKDKLGTRSLATGEIEFDGALAEAIGPLDHGFRNLVGIVLDTSRVHNAVGACGFMRRALVEGQRYANHRRAFGRPIGDFPAVQQILARMVVRTRTALTTTFRILAMSDRLGEADGDKALADARRIAVMINKYWTAIACTATVHDGIELLGGNGTIEDFSSLPRLYRDALVVESWEGTHNTLCAQVLRDFTARGLHRPWLASVAAEIEQLADGPGAELARNLHGEVARRIERLLASDERTATAHARHVVDRMCHLTDWVALATQAGHERRDGLDGDTAQTLELYRLLALEPADIQDSPALVDLNAKIAMQARSAPA